MNNFAKDNLFHKSVILFIDCKMSEGFFLTFKNVFGMDNCTKNSTEKTREKTHFLIEKKKTLTHIQATPLYCDYSEVYNCSVNVL